MKTIPLVNSDISALVNNADFERCRVKRWRLTHDGYVRSTDSSLTFMHILIMGYAPSDGWDHKNGLKHDCQRDNLRPATVSQNGANRKISKNNSSGYKGVDWNGGQWRVRLAVEKKRLYLGHFRDVIEAARSYDRAAKKHFGEYARLNFPETA
jgi:hypothetical protein